MNAAARQTTLALLLPGLAVCAAYVFTFRAVVASEVRGAQDALTEIRRGSPTAEGASRETQRVMELEAEIQRLRDERAAFDSAHPSTAAAPRARGASSAVLTARLGRHKLLLLDESPAALPGTAAAPDALRRSTDGVAESGGSLRTVRFQGRFLDVLAALEELAASSAAVVPVRLTMAPDPDESGPAIWSLVLWM